MDTKHIAEYFLNELKLLESYAASHTKCKRKAVGCSIHAWDPYDDRLMVIARAHNGPSCEDFRCTNVVGDCGCSHSEPRVIMQALRKMRIYKELFMVCTYSPCTNCANVILDSGIVKGLIYGILTDHDTRGWSYLYDDMDVLSKESLEDILGTLPELEIDSRVILEQWNRARPEFV